MIKKIFSNTFSRIWFIVTAIVVVLLTVVTIVASTAVYDVFNLVMPGGGVRAVYAEGIEPIYVSEYKNKKEVYDAACEFNKELCRDGFILLKNENKALPLETPVSNNKVAAKPKISVFGKNSVDISYGGSGSGGTTVKGNPKLVDLHKALGDAGYDVNPTLTAFYADTAASGEKRKENSKDLDTGDSVVLSTAETPQSKYSDSVKNSYSAYNDMAVVVITRIGGEGFDLPRSMKGASGYVKEDDHFLQLDANERDMLNAVCSGGFKKVVVLINSGSAMELTFLKDKTYFENADKIDAAVWMGYPGDNGTVAVAEILNGVTNPSGRTPDIYAADYKKDPTWFNFGDNREVGKVSGGKVENLGGDQYTTGGNEGAKMNFFVDYEEGVYVGYKYYETAAVENHIDYNSAVVYPFGYGLSYETDFAWSVEAPELKGSAISGTQKYSVKVNVKNNGTRAGKDVVQLYSHAPYTAGGIEKPYVTLVGFGKTDLIKPGETDTVEISFDPYYAASYDHIDANKNGFKGYELEGGNYELFVSKNSHDVVDKIGFTVAPSGIKYEKDPVSKKSVVNRYTDCEDEYFDSDLQLTDVTVNGETRKGMSRSAFSTTWPTTPTLEDRTVDKAFLDALADTRHNNPNKYTEMPNLEEENDIVLRDLLYNADGEPINTDAEGIPHISYNDDRWDDLLNQCTVSEMAYVYDYAAYKTNAIESIGLPKASDADGPVGWRSFMDKSTFYDTCSYCAEVVVGATWNTELVRKFGEMVGEEGIIGNDRGDKMPYSGWYAPGANIHRSPFGGRNFEYYSEDGFLSGVLAASQIKGCQSKGVFCFIKHFALNEQETHRSINGDSSWVTEQAMREIFLRPFEIAVKDGGTRAVMSSFNRIGTRWAGGDYRMLTDILRNEWGFKGTVLCDFNTCPEYMISRQMAYAGGDLNLATQPVSWVNESSAADVYVLRQCIKNVCYTVGNSNAMNGDIIGYMLPIWQIFLIVIDCVVFAGLAVWGFFAVRKALKANNVPT